MVIIIGAEDTVTFHVLGAKMAPNIQNKTRAFHL